jgi:CubicO group peptidase (beta-lactamase class C family)
MRLTFYALLFSLTTPYYISAQDTANNKQQDAERNLHKVALIIDDAPATAYTLTERMRERKVNGLSIAVIDKGKIAWAKGYGIKDAGIPNEAVDTTTLFQCASIGKVITAMVALHLVKKGLIGLDEPVNNKLKSWKVPENDKTVEKKVTLRTLLSHTAGFDDDYGFEGYPPHTMLPDLQQILNGESPANSRKKLIVKTVPGTVERYSGGGFLVVQQLIEDIASKSFSSYADSIIFKPLGMSHTTYAYYPDEIPGMTIARGHDEKGKIDKKRKYHLYPESAAAGPWTIATDLARLVIEMQKEYSGLSNIIADSALVREMITPQINTTGLGIHLKGTRNVSAFWHSGNNAGYTGVFFGTTSDQGAIVLTNSDDGAWLALEIIRSIADVYNWPAMQTQYLKKTIEGQYDRFIGEYRKGKTQVTIGKNNEGLFLDSGNDKKVFTLYQTKDGSFIIKEKPDHLKLVFSEDREKNIQLLFFQDCGKAVGELQKVQ